MQLTDKDCVAIRTAQDRCALEAHGRIGIDKGQQGHSEIVRLESGTRVRVSVTARTDIEKALTDKGNNIPTDCPYHMKHCCEFCNDIFCERCRAYAAAMERSDNG